MNDREVPAQEVAEMVLPALGAGERDPRDGRHLPAWHAELLARPSVPGLPTVGIWRVRGGAEGGDWSAILKVLRAPTGSSAWAGHPDPEHPFYWRREAEVLGRLSRGELSRGELSRGELDARVEGGHGGIRMPRCYGVVDRSDGTVAIWMEDIRGLSASGWDLEGFGRFARRFARFHACALTAETVTAGEPWLGRQWLRTYVGRRDPVGEVLQDADVWEHPAVRKHLDPGRAEQFEALWHRRYAYLAEVDAQPQVLCHLDLHPLNLFDVGDETVLIDWAFCGIGGVGEDLGTLLIDAACDFHLAPARLGALFDTLVANYAAASPLYDEPLIRRAIATAALARFAWLVPALISALVEGRERLNGRPIDDTAPAWGAACGFLLELAAEVDASPDPSGT